MKRDPLPANPVEFLLPVVQLVIRVGNGDAGLLQIADGAGDVSGGHVVAWIVVVPNHQDAFIMTTCGEDDEIVQVLEVSVVPCRDGPKLRMAWAR